MSGAAPFPLIDVAGAPYERGESYGRQAAERIAVSVAIYRRAFDASGKPWSELRGVAGHFATRLANYDRDQFDELRGIAAGARRELEEIVAINARTELLYAPPPPLSEDPHGLTEGCTAALALPSATKQGHLLHGQNWDWRDDCVESTIVLRVRPPAGPTLLTLVEAGTLARCGLNSAGIAITGNFLKCDHDTGHLGIPVPMVRRRVLQSTTLHDAMMAVVRAPRSFSNNVMISHAGGEAIDLETTPLEVHWLAPDADGVLVHANHFQSESGRTRVRDLGLAVTPDSLYRDRRVRARLRAALGALTERDLAEAFADRYGEPFGVCRAPTVGPGGERSSTVASVIMNTTRRVMWVAPAPYRGGRYYEYPLEGETTAVQEASSW